ncbi:Acyl-coenzyme A:6-aminopenicillanic-acid-acyltransferase form [Rhynchospora pubera]|uniref:Acyl-coenzyme A:6-aminopenicillanic-acid-acyltransferase form n=2 Tax=Rhynchospora pubera TaxID=906938 RepID=A0AAV8HT30_9POAL|nr:Acyl-coenzyme A:6-aminopenicillanic-acid-acyltransferase form [Rhynchospora pubera]
MDGGTLETFHVGPCGTSYEMGYLIGERFSNVIRSRVEKDLILQEQLLPFASTAEGHSLVEALERSNKERYPRYWDELVGTARGSGVPLLHILLLNLRKEMLPFVPKEELTKEPVVDDDCSDVLVVNDAMAIAVHNEDGNVVLVGHTYLVKAVLPRGLSFTAYTYAGELPSCAFGFNSHGVAFTLNSVPPLNNEIMAGGIGRNFVSRDLLEAYGLDDALHRIRKPNVSVGHCYNLIDIKSRRILNIETASNNRLSIHEVGEDPFFHANMYLHLKIDQIQDENSSSRQKRAAMLPADSQERALSLLGDTNYEKYPIFMTGPILHTLCTVLIDVDRAIVTIYKGNPKNGDVSNEIHMNISL